MVSGVLLLTFAVVHVRKMDQVVVVLTAQVQVGVNVAA